MEVVWGRVAVLEGNYSMWNISSHCCESFLSEKCESCLSFLNKAMKKEMKIYLFCAISWIRLEVFILYFFYIVNSHII